MRRTADGWRSTDRQGEEHVIKNPGEQASKAVHAIRRYLDDAAGFGGKGLRCRFGWGVVLPDIECPFDMGPDLPRDVILDRSDFVRLREAVDRVFARRVGDGQPLSQVGADAFVAALEPHAGQSQPQPAGASRRVVIRGFRVRRRASVVEREDPRPYTERR